MRAIDFVDSYFDAWNHSDAKGVADHLAKNGTYCDIPTHQQFSRDELITNLVGFFASEDRCYELTSDVLCSDNAIAFQYTMSSNNPKSESWSGAEFIALKGDGAVRITDYYDPMHSVSSLSAVTDKINAPKYAKSGLDDRQLENYKHQLADLMDHHKAYLDPDLTLPKLAAMVDCSVNHLSVSYTHLTLPTTD